MTTDRDLEKKFRRIDTDHDNAITIEELRQYYLPVQQMLGMAPQLAEEEIKSLIKRLDIDGDGKISLDEFKDFVSKS